MTRQCEDYIRWKRIEPTFNDAVSRYQKGERGEHMFRRILHGYVYLARLGTDDRIKDLPAGARLRIQVETTFWKYRCTSCGRWHKCQNAAGLESCCYCRSTLIEDLVPHPGDAPELGMRGPLEPTDSGGE